MSLVNFTNLDFDQIKTSIKDYLRSNSNFTDYDFEGSNLSVIIDLLAYNTYITSYNANMISNEVFIDSATLRENVVSLARNIGYVPRSKKCSKTNINFFVDLTNSSFTGKALILKRGLVCNSPNYNGVNYSFSIVDDISVPVVDGIANFENIEVLEGTYITNNFVVDSANSNQRFILDNANIDSSTIRVSVRESQNDKSSVKYKFKENIFDIDSESPIFFIQEITDQRYEIIFGDGIFGKKLGNNNYIEVSYLVTNGIDANGISDLFYSGRIINDDGVLVTDSISLITANSSTYGGSEIESLNSIRNYAPRIYSTQNRAVTSSDYESIIPKIYPEVESISVYGGEDLSPPQYGKVFIAIKPFYGSFVPSIIKDNIKEKLRQYVVAGIIPEIIDLKYLYVELESDVYCDENLYSSQDYVKSIIVDNITKYSKSKDLNRYGARFKYSRYQNIIDTSHNSVVSNITKVQIRRDLSPSLNQFANYELCFGNPFHIKDLNGYNIKSSGFIISGISSIVYISDIPNLDKKTGSLFLFTIKSETEAVIVKQSIGTIDYEKGELLLQLLNVISTEKTNGGVPIIEISAIPRSNDVIGLQELYLQLDVNNTKVNIITDEISSGNNPSGSNYIISSSYVNGDLVRK
jgi:uncharacterized protein YjbI with pentapeptide repeats